MLENIAQSLVRVTDGNMDALRSCLILLPTRRAIRVLEEKLLSAFQLPTILLPHLMAIGDIELPPEDEDSGRLPPRSIAGLERIVSLMPYLEKHNLGGHHFNGRWRMAQEVARLIDLLQTEDLDIDAIGKMIAAADLASHWQDNGGLFERVAREWLADLATVNRINSAAGRTLRIQNLIDNWQEDPPQTPVWLVGSTGSIPAVRRLMKQILSLPAGSILLPGVDMIMNDAEWAAMSDAHPQAILRRTITDLGYDSREVMSWPDCKTDKNITERQRFLSAALSPFPRVYNAIAENAITIINAPTQQQEAEAITDYCLSHYKNNPEKSIVIVTNDPAMTQRLLPLLSAYEIDVNPSAGISIANTSIGTALSAFLRIFTSDARILDLWSLIKRADFAHYWVSNDRANIILGIEKKYLREPLKVPETIADLMDLFPENTLTELQSILKRSSDKKTLGEWAYMIIQAITLHFSPVYTIDKLAIDAALRALEEVVSLASDYKISYDDAAVPLCDVIMRAPIRSPYQSKHSLSILGTMEARLLYSDVVIIAGLNEGIWPDTQQSSPFISRGMRHKIGLPDTERNAALAGHDFQQSFLMPEIVISYAERNVDAPLLPARWLMRLKAITTKELWSGFIEKGNHIMASRRNRHSANSYAPASPPAPKVKKEDVIFPIYVTHLETWRSDPYSFWAKHILRLRKLNPLLGGINALTRGISWHKIFRDFVEAYDSHPDKNKLFNDCTDRIFTEDAVRIACQRTWKSRLLRLTSQYLTYEGARRESAKPFALEKEWEGKIGSYEFKAKADRVDIENHGAYSLLDYKTGAPPLPKEIENGIACQLSLLALMIDNPVSEIEYLSVSGGRPPLKIVKREWDNQFAEATERGVINWIDMFLDKQQAFISLSDFGKLKNTDYVHLSRAAEWGTKI